MAARVVGIRREGVNPCRMVPSMKGRGTRQLHDVTGKVQSARPCIAVQMHDVRVAALKLHDLEIEKKKNYQKQASLSGEQDSQVSGERPPVWGTGLPLVRGMG